MNSSDLQLTLRALDRLPPHEARGLESTLAENPTLAAELRATEDTITALWLATAPLQSAPPEALATIHKKLHPVRCRPAVPLTLAALGWAAAIILAALLLTRPTSKPPIISSGNDPVRATPQPLPPSPTVPPRPRPASQDDLQRETIRRLREELLAARSQKTGPRIRELRSPGDTTRVHPTDRDRALLELLTSALADKLARRSESPATLVVENGWISSDFASLPEDGVIRHRAFPTEDFANYELLRSPDGNFFDPLSGILWSPAQDGGGYLGHPAPTDLDLTHFDAAPPEPRTPTEPATPEAKASPSGYLVQSETDGSATIIIGNLPTDGEPPKLVASTDGGQTTIPLTPTGIWPGVNSSGFASFSVDDSGHYLLPSSANSGRIDLSILQPKPDGSFTTILTESP